MRLKHGLLEQADGGTLFLDEIGDMPLAMQVKLLRVLQERTVTRLGGEQSIAVDFRLVSATHRDLKKLVERGTFREDLFYRVNVVHLRVPPLRERPEDILWYARRFLREVAQQNGGPPEGPVAGARRRRSSITCGPATCANCATASSAPMCLRPATRSIRNVLFDEEQACGDCGVAVNCVGVEQPTLSNCLEECERQYLLQELTRHDWQMTKTAAAIGISRKNLWERLRRLNLHFRRASFAKRTDRLPLTKSRASRYVGDPRAGQTLVPYGSGSARRGGRSRSRRKLGWHARTRNANN